MSVIVAVVVLSGVLPLASRPAAAAVRTPVRTLDLGYEVSDIELDPTRPLAYLSARGNNSVLVFSFTTLDIVARIVVGSEPYRMDVDPLTDRLYVALGGGPGVAVVNLATRAVDAVWPVGSGAYDVAVGRPGRLYASRTVTWGQVAILDSVTGALVGNVTDPMSVYWGPLLEASPDKRTLYIGETGLSNANLYRVDVTTDTAALTGQVNLGEFLNDMVLSPDGRFLYAAANWPGSIQAVDTAALAVAGNMTTGLYPTGVARSADGSTVLGAKYDTSDLTFYSFNATTYARVDSFHTSGGTAWRVATDRTGQYLLAFSWGYRAPPYVLNVYSMSSPPNLPPVAAFTYSPAAPVVNRVVFFNASSSVDPEGAIVSCDWTFGDGNSGVGEFPVHIYLTVGSFPVTLTVVDDVGQRNSTTQTVTVTDIPDVPPTAEFTISPAQPAVGDIVVFDGTASSDPYWAIAEWGWAFSDGGTGWGVAYTRRFMTAGDLSVTLTVMNSNGRTGTATRSFTVSPAPILDLVMYEHPSGFRLPVPSAWPRTVDESIQGVTYELILDGPVRDGFMTNIVVDTDRDTSVRETPEYLLDLADSVISDLGQGDPLTVIESPGVRSLAGHAGVVFAVRYDTGMPFVQKFAVIVSDVHDRYWILLLSAAASYFPVINGTFEAMIAGFEITLAPPAFSNVPWYAWFAIAAGIGGIVAVAVAVVLRRKRARQVVCPGCGARLAPTFTYCNRCGRPLGGRTQGPGTAGPPGGPPPPPSPPPPG